MCFEFNFGSKPKRRALPAPRMEDLALLAAGAAPRMAGGRCAPRAGERGSSLGGGQDTWR